MRRVFGLALVCVAVVGCATPPAFQENPTLVGEPRPGGYEQVWNTTVRVLNRYFDIASENRYVGRIETLPQSGATLIEPWRVDAVDLFERLEGTLQTIRRRGYIQIQPAPAGGYLIQVEVYKELEHLPQPAFANFGGGTLITSQQPIRETLIDQDVLPGAGWISLGRDLKLEARILSELRLELGAAAEPPAAGP